MMFLPVELRQQLGEQGITPPDDGTAELDRWVRSLRTESPDVYKLVLAHASASAPPLDSEQLAARQQRAGTPARTVRRLFSRRTAHGERLPNRKLAVTSILAVVGVALFVGMVISGYRQLNRPRAEEPPPPTQAAPAPPGPPPVAAAQPKPAASPPAGAPQISLPGRPGQVPAITLPPLPQGGAPVPPLTASPVGASGPVVYEQQKSATPGSTVVYGQSQAANEEATAARPAGIVVYDTATSAAQAQAQPQAVQVITPGAPSAAAQAPPAAPVVSLQPGQLIEATLQTGIVAAEGAPTPVVLKSAEGIWLGAAQVVPGGRVQVTIQQLVADGRSLAVQAVALDKETMAAGLSGKTRTVNAQTAQALLAAAAQGVAEFMKATASAAKVTITNGFVTIVNGPAGPWWSYILGGLATAVPQLAPAPGKPVTIVEIARNTPVTILVLAAP